MWLSGFPSTSYWRYCPFPIVNSWFLCQKLNDHVCIGLFFGLSILFHWPTCQFLITISYSFDCCDFVAQFLNQQIGYSTLSFYLKIALALLDPFWFHTNFSVCICVCVFNFFVENGIGILMQLHWICRLLSVIWTA